MMGGITVLARPLTLALSPQAGRGDDRAFGRSLGLKRSWDDRASRISLLPACGEKVPDRADEGPLRQAVKRDEYDTL